MVLTLHDPFIHSGRETKQLERDRIRAFQHIRKIILLNKNQMDDFIKTYKVPKQYIYVSKLGMYDSITRVTPIPFKSKGPYILFFGLIAEYKGLEYLMNAMKKIHKKFPDIKLVVAGSGKFYFDVTPFRDVNFIEIHNHYISVPELAGMLYGCLFSVCPYIDATQSGVIQTAFSLNVPMVVTNVGTLPEVVKDGETGLVVPPCDVDALSNAMNHLIEHPELLESMRNNIEKNWKPSMSWGPIADKYIECYNTKVL